MEGFDTVRAVARRAHDDAAMKANGERSASKLLEGATRLTGIPRQGVQDGDPVLCGAEAILDPQTPAIFYKQSVPEEKAAFYQAHEFGHHFLDNASGACSAADIDDIMPEERMVVAKLSSWPDFLSDEHSFNVRQAIAAIVAALS